MKNILGRSIKGTPINKANNQDKLTEQIAKRFLDFLQEQIQQDQTDESNFQEELDSTLENEWGFTGEEKAKTKALFFEAVNNNISRLQDGLADLVGQYGSVEGDVVERLSDYITKLQDEIQYYENENGKLASEQVSKLSESFGVNESVVSALWNQSSGFSELNDRLTQAAKPNRPVKKSYVEEDMEELNEDGTFAGKEPYIDPQMRKYLNYL